MIVIVFIYGSGCWLLGGFSRFIGECLVVIVVGICCDGIHCYLSRISNIRITTVYVNKPELATTYPIATYSSIYS